MRIFPLLATAVLACQTTRPQRQRPEPPAPPITTPAAPTPVQRGAIESVALRLRLPHHTTPAELAWAPDGAHLATGDDDGLVRIWDPRRDRPTCELPRHERRISALAHSPDGTRLAVAALTDLRVWDLHTGALLQRLPGHGDIISDLRFVGPELYVVDLRNSLRRWDVAAGRVLADLEVPTVHSLSLAISPGATALAIGGYGELELIDLPARTPRFKLTMPRCDHDPGDLLCARWKSRQLEEFGHDGASPTTHKADTPQWYVQDLAFSADGALLLAGRADGVAILIDTTTGKPLARLTLGDDKHAAVALTPDGATAALANRDGQISLWDLATKRQLPITHEPGQPVTALAFSPDATTLAAAGPGPAVTLWDLARRTAIHPPRAQAAPKLAADTGDHEHLRDVPDVVVVAERQAEAERTAAAAVDEQPGRVTLAIDAGGQAR